MNEFSTTHLLAAGFDVTTYVSLYKIGIVTLLTIAWGFAAEWVDRDTDVVKTKREQWNLIVISGAAVGFFVLLVPPWYGALYFVGLAFWILIAGGAMIAYLIHRNGRVIPARQVFTVAHLRRLAKADPSKKQAAVNKGIRIQLLDHTRKTVAWPDDPEESRDFEATQDFLHDLLWRRATDVDLAQSKDGFRLIYKIDGVASEDPEGVSTETGERILRFIKKNAGLNVEEVRRPQSGKVQVALLSHAGEIGITEVLTSGTTAGERLRLRIETAPLLKRVHELGIHPQRLEILKNSVLGKSKGLLLMGAPPHNGLTTTQYAILRSHDAYMHNIHALERRSVIDLDNITQQIYDGRDNKVSYARMLQTVLRREPDIIMVDNCADKETAMVATRAAVQDRKIYLAIQAKDCFDALQGFLAFLEDNQMAANAIRGVMAQRLVRVLCTECREAYRPEPATLKKLNLPADKIERFYRPPSEPKRDRKGKVIPCPNCQGTGYLGRAGVFEVLAVDENITALIAAGAPVSKIKSLARKNRMYYMQEEALLKVIDGTTSMNEVLRCLRTEEKA